MTYSIALATLADPTRRAVFERLRAASVGEIASGLPVSRPAVSLDSFWDDALTRFKDHAEKET